ncbi:MAG: hypothetical protein RR033_01865 [Clostridia bacterium]
MEQPKISVTTDGEIDVSTIDEIDTYARTEIEGYRKLSEPAKVMVRETIRTGRAQNVSEADIKFSALVAVYSGINVVFSQKLCDVGTKSDGSTAYADGFYDIKNKRIVINPNFSEKNIGFTTKSGEIIKIRNVSSILVHELAYAIYNTTDRKLIVEKTFSNLSEKDKTRIKKLYAGSDTVVKIDEITAHYAEGILTDDGIIERLTRTEKGFKEKILDFIKGSYKAYKSDPQLSKEAKALYKHYKQLFDSFSEQNRGKNAVVTETITETSAAHRFALADIDTMTEKEYNNSGWSKVHDKLTPKEYGFFAAMARRMRSGEVFDKSADGLYIIETGEKNTTNKDGVHNVLVYTNGDFESPSIERIVRITGIYNDTDLAPIRTEVYKYEQEGNRFSPESPLANCYAETRLFSFDERRNFPSFRKLKEQRTQSLKDTGNSTEQSERGDNLTTGKSNKRLALPEGIESALVSRKVYGDALLEALDLAEDIAAVGGKVTADGKAVLYHATTAANAERIKASGKMYGKEPNIYFSTKKDGEITSYGDTVVSVKIPLEPYSCTVISRCKCFKHLTRWRKQSNNLAVNI